MDANEPLFSQATLAVPEPEQTNITSSLEVPETPETEPAAAADEPTTPETPEEPTADETPEPEPEPETPEAIQQESHDEIFSRTFREKYGYDTVEEYLEANKPEEKQPAYSDTIRKLIEWESKGLKPDDFFRTQTQDFEAMSDIDKVKNYLAMENPDYTPEDIDLLIEDEFKLDSEEYDEKTVRLGQLKLKQRAKDALPKLKEWQVKAATPPVDTAAEEAQRQIAAYHTQVEQQLKDFSSIEVTLDDKGGKVSIPIADRKQVEAMVKDVNSFFADYVATDATGKAQYKVKEMATALYIAKNWSSVSQKIAAQARSKGVREVETVLNNSSDTQRREQPAVDVNSPLSRLGKLASEGRI